MTYSLSSIWSQNSFYSVLLCQSWIKTLLRWKQETLALKGKDRCPINTFNESFAAGVTSFPQSHAMDLQTSCITFSTNQFIHIAFLLHSYIKMPCLSISHLIYQTLLQSVTKTKPLDLGIVFNLQSAKGNVIRQTENRTVTCILTDRGAQSCIYNLRL